MSGKNSDRIEDLKLVPTRPPGRITRKARGFAPQIRELQAQGYTLDAIQEALAAAGVVVSRSTVHREATRAAKAGGLARPIHTGSPLSPSRDDGHAGEASDWLVPGGSVERSPIRAESGKEIAAEFMKDRITNPYFRNRS